MARHVRRKPSFIFHVRKHTGTALSLAVDIAQVCPFSNPSLTLWFLYLLLIHLSFYPSQTQFHSHSSDHFKTLCNVCTGKALTDVTHGLTLRSEVHGMLGHSTIHTFRLNESKSYIRFSVFFSFQNNPDGNRL